jgi:hypothetical protein
VFVLTTFVLTGFLILKLVDLEQYVAYSQIEPTNDDKSAVSSSGSSSSPSCLTCISNLATRSILFNAQVKDLHLDKARETQTLLRLDIEGTISGLSHNYLQLFNLPLPL